MWVGCGDPGPLPSCTETQEGEGRQPHGPERHPGAARGWHRFATPFRSLRALVTGVSRQSGNGTAVQGRGGAEPRLSILPGAAGSAVPLRLPPRQRMVRVQAAAPGCGGRALAGTTSQPHRDPTCTRRDAPPSRGEAPGGGLLGGRPSAPWFCCVALVTPEGPCLGPPGPGTVPQGTRQGFREGGPGPRWPWVPALCLPGQTPPWAPAPSLRPRQWAPGGCLSSSPKK